MSDRCRPGFGRCHGEFNQLRPLRRKIPFVHIQACTRHSYLGNRTPCKRVSPKRVRLRRSRSASGAGWTWAGCQFRDERVLARRGSDKGFVLARRWAPQSCSATELDHGLDPSPTRSLCLPALLTHGRTSSLMSAATNSASAHHCDGTNCRSEIRSEKPTDWPLQAWYWGDDWHRHGALRRVRRQPSPTSWNRRGQTYKVGGPHPTTEVLPTRRNPDTMPLPSWAHELTSPAGK